MLTVTSKKHPLFLNAIILNTMRQPYSFIALLYIGQLIANGTILNAQSLPESSSAGTDDIEFFENYEQVTSLATAFNMPIILYVYDSYSRSCVDMERMVFADSEVAELYNKSLVCYKLSINSTEGMKYYNYAKSRPAFIYLNSQLEIIKVESGFKDKETFLQLGKDAISNNTIRENPIDFKYTKFLDDKNVYDNRVRDKDFLRDYLYELKSFSEPYEQVITEFTNLQAFSLTSPDCAKVILDFTDDIYSQPFELLIANKQLFVELFGKSVVDRKIHDAFRATVLSAINDRSRVQMENALNLIPKAKLADGNLLSYTLQALYYENIGDWNNFAVSIDNYLKNTELVDDAFLERSARYYAYAVSDENKLKSAENWVIKALSIKGSRHKTLETYAIVLYQLGKKSKALNVLDNAIATAQKQRVDYGSSIRFAEDMRSNKALNPKYK